MEGVRLEDLRAEVANLVFQCLRGQSLGHDQAELLDVERLGEVIGRADLHGLHGGLDHLDGGQHDHGNRGILRTHGLQEPEPVRPGQDHIQKH